MTDIAELRKRKQPLNLSIVYVDPAAFVANYMGWLEITALISALRADEVQVPADGQTPRLTEQQYAPVTLEDFVGQAGKKMLLGDKPPPPLRAKENWTAGLRFLEKARKSDFVHEIMYPLAKWHRERWTGTLEKEVAFLHHIEDNVPVLREVLDVTQNDEPFIANLLLKMAPAVDMGLTDDTRGYLRSLARPLQTSK